MCLIFRLFLRFSGIELQINVNYCIENPSMQDSYITVKTIHWNSEKAVFFENNCDTSRIRDLVDLLDNLSNKTINKQDIDDVASKIEDLFEHACLESVGTRTIKQKNVNKLSKPWFNIDCRNARNSYHKTRRLYNKHKTERYKTLLKNVSKHYKNTVSKNIKKHRDEKIHKLRNLKTSNSKEFWRIINDDKCKPNKSAPLQDLYEYFKNINEHEDNPAHELNNDTDSFTHLNEEINKHITEDEIIKAIHSLKLNKSPGADDILNEHLKSSKHVMLPVYVKLFNLIFDTGIVPES